MPFDDADTNLMFEAIVPNIEADSFIAATMGGHLEIGQSESRFADRAQEKGNGGPAL